MIATSKVTDSLQVKTEVGFAHYLHHRLRNAGISYRTSSRGGEAAEYPLILLAASDLEAHPDLPYVQGNFTITLEVSLHWDPNDEQRRPVRLDEALEDVQSAMIDLADAQLFLNIQNNKVDQRPVDQFHLYDIEPAGITQTTDGARWIESRSFVCTICGGNNLFAPTTTTTARYITLGGDYITLGGDRITLAS